ncbi:LysR family transcriptional regulator [Streptomyces mashuensis]|uniref:LysR family transcriptional regulator n=1 Tax=Streptomyces mashuensis TaxID=33904 RepID=A0A919EFY9_9ACTN|nr:LysR family transcriptional regulator [Streptomyces mashuensis]GHF67086.1 LysR family transcriptional regulator [Streptomyces mashuensis]
MITLRQLEYLVSVVEEGSLTRAAERLYVTQPALSHQLRALERSIGGPLLERLPRSVRLTPMGRALLPHARAALDSVRQGQAAARQAAGAEAGELRIATLHSVSLGVLPPALRVWRRRHPGVRVHLVEHRNSGELAAAMGEGRADIAVGPPPVGWEGPVCVLGVEEFLVVLAAEEPGPATAHGDGGPPRIGLAGLADREWVHYGPGNGLAVVVDDACAAAGFRPRAAVRTEQTASAPVLAAAGLGPALVPANIVPVAFGGRLFRPDPPVQRVLAAYTRIRPDPLTDAFIDLLQREASMMPGHVRRQLEGG